MNTDKLRETYNEIAEGYLRYPHQNWDNDFIRYFAKALKPGSRILDLGCGPGIESKIFAELDFDVYGFDLSDHFIELARKQVANGHFTQGDMRNLLYEDEYFDGIFCKASLLHIPKNEIDVVLKEITRVLRKNGLLHVALKKGDDEGDITDDRYGETITRFFSFWKEDKFRDKLLSFPYELIKEDAYLRPGSKTTWLKFLFRKV